MLGDRFAAKVVRLGGYGGYDDPVEGLFHEALFADYLYENGVHVPRPEGVFAIPLPDRLEIAPGFVMEYVFDGIKPGDIPDRYSDEAHRQWTCEIEKVERLGVIPDDHSEELNYLWRTSTREVCLHDFARWE